MIEHLEDIIRDRSDGSQCLCAGVCDWVDWCVVKF